MFKRSLWIWVTLFLCFSGSLWAHGINLFVAAEGDVIKGRISYEDGHGAESGIVRISDAAGHLLVEVNPDPDGRFTFQATQKMDHLIVADTQDGHVVKRWVKAEMLSDPLSPPTDQHELPGLTAHQHAVSENEIVNSRMEQVVARQIMPLREEIAAYQAQIRFRDIVGGLGYIIGLAGLALWLSRRKQTVD